MTIKIRHRLVMHLICTDFPMTIQGYFIKLSSFIEASNLKKHIYQNVFKT